MEEDEKTIKLNIEIEKLNLDIWKFKVNKDNTILFSVFAIIIAIGIASSNTEIPSADIINGLFLFISSLLLLNWWNKRDKQHQKDYKKFQRKLCSRYNKLGKIYKKKKK